MALSDTQARNAKPKDKPYKFTDANDEFSFFMLYHEL